MAPDVRERARCLRNGVELSAAAVSYAPEAHAAHSAPGFDGGLLAAHVVARVRALG